MWHLTITGSISFKQRDQDGIGAVNVSQEDKNKTMD